MRGAFNSTLGTDISDVNIVAYFLVKRSLVNLFITAFLFKVGNYIVTLSCRMKCCNYR